MKKFIIAFAACMVSLSAVFCFSAGAAQTTSLGDVNSDGCISIKDATEIQMHLAGLSELADEALTNADVNGNGAVDISDVTYIQKYLARLINGFPQSGEGASTTEEQTTQAQATTAAYDCDSEGYNNVIVRP